MRYKYILQSAREAVAIFQAFHKEGYRIDLFDGNLEVCAAKYWQSYPELILDISNKHIGGNVRGGSRPENTEVSLNQVFALLDKHFKKIKLNDKYTAIVCPDGSVEVGCQTFSAKVARELAVEILAAFDKHQKKA